MIRQYSNTGSRFPSISNSLSSSHFALLFVDFSFFCDRCSSSARRLSYHPYFVARNLGYLPAEDLCELIQKDIIPEWGDIRNEQLLPARPHYDEAIYFTRKNAPRHPLPLSHHTTVNREKELKPQRWREREGRSRERTGREVRSEKNKRAKQHKPQPPPLQPPRARLPLLPPWPRPSRGNTPR